MTTSAYALSKSNQTNNRKVNRVKIITTVSVAVVLYLLGGMSFAGNVEAGLGDVTMTSDTTIPFKSDGPSFAAMLAKLLVGTVVGLGLALAVGYAIKRWYFQNQQSGKVKSCIAVREAKRITPRMTVYIVNIDGREHKLVQSGDHILELRGNGVCEGKDDVVVQLNEQ